MHDARCMIQDAELGVPKTNENKKNKHQPNNTIALHHLKKCTIWLGENKKTSTLENKR